MWNKKCVCQELLISDAGDAVQAVMLQAISPRGVEISGNIYEKLDALHGI